MPRGKPHSEATVDAVRAKSQRGHGVSEIARDLELTKSTVQSILDRIRKGQISPRKRGPHPVLTLRTLRAISYRLSGDCHTSVRKLQKELAPEVHHMTMWRSVKKMEFKSRRLKILPMLSNRNLEARINFATEHLSQTTNWNKVIFSDEKRFKLNGPDGYNYVWTRLASPNDNMLYSTSCRDRRGITVWLAFSSRGILALLRTSNTLTAETYSKMVIDVALPCFRAAHGDDFIF